ncbi:MAG: CcmD family protein [Saprospiraceae bacterium]|nr:CcmD family protein [Saprospiraceae bacterium]MDW8230555.1 CcmD family protein [Saprospiraceae bacterium]
MPRTILTFVLWLGLSLPAAFAEGNRDFMRETGKIYVVVATLVVIFLGIVGYLVRLERKLTKIEHLTKDDA